MMTKLAALTVALSLAATSVAHAQAPGQTRPLDPDAIDSIGATGATGDEGPKNPGTALLLSLGGTAASAALVIAGGENDSAGMITAGLVTSLVTPSLGEWYAGKPLTAGMGIRAASAAATMVGFAQALSCIDAEGSCQSADSAGVLIAGGLIGYATGTIYDIATAPRVARAYNRHHAVTLQPAMVRTPGGMTTVGVGIGGTFE